MKRYDLHCHSTYSDGTMTPQELVRLACEKELSGISITDHDTFQAYFDVVDAPISVIAGIEISAEFEQKSVHVLGYAFNPHDQEFQDFCLRQRVWRRERLSKMCELLTKQGAPLDPAFVMTSDDPNYTWGRVHVAVALIKKGYVADVGQAFKRYIGDKAPCYVSGNKCSVQEAIDAIHKAGGYSVLAHPHLIDSKSFTRRLLAHNFDGIEAYYGRFGKQENEHWAKKAEARGMFVTGGSDFHGTVKPESFLGSSFAPEGTVQKFLEGHA